jgi:hypothetical protein
VNIVNAGLMALIGGGRKLVNFVAMWLISSM